MGQVLNMCCGDSSDRSTEITIEQQKKAPAADGPTPTVDGYPEEFGSTDFDALFAAMKENSDKEISVRESRKDPPGSLAARFWINEQIYKQAIEEKFPTNSIDLHVIRVKEALQMTEDRFDEIKRDLGSGKLHNVGDGKNHLFKVICGQGTHSDENGPKMKGAMSEWL